MRFSEESIHCKGKVGCGQTLKNTNSKWEPLYKAFPGFPYWEVARRLPHGSAATCPQILWATSGTALLWGITLSVCCLLKLFFLFANNIQAQKLWLTSSGLMWWKSIFTLNRLFQITDIYLIRLHYALSYLPAYKKKDSAQGFGNHCSGSFSPWNTVTTRRDKLKINECAVLDVLQSRIFM